MNLQLLSLESKCQTWSVLCKYAHLHSLLVGKDSHPLVFLVSVSWVNRNDSDLNSRVASLHLREGLMCFSCPGITFALAKCSYFAIKCLTGNCFSFWYWATCSFPTPTFKIWKYQFISGKMKELTEILPSSCLVRCSQVKCVANCWFLWWLSPTWLQLQSSIKWFCSSK